MKKKKKVGIWSAKWNNQALLDVGGQYCNRGKKQGQWKEIFKNYSEKTQIYEEGLYKDDLRIAIWNIIYENSRIGGGCYNEQGQKTGLWQELSNTFFCDNQILYFGEYLDGQKIDGWESLKKRLPIFLNLNGCKKKQNQPFEIIGQQYYDKQGKKNGKWVQASDHFKESAQISYCGEYRGEKKCGIWDFNYQIYSNRPSKLIGCGVYDGQGCKNGKWVEPCEQFSEDCWIISEGQYRNGIKVGKWEISCQKVEQTDTEPEKIGYGFYDDQGLKVGVWLELDDSFCRTFREVIYQGEYRKNHKIGKWEIKYKREAFSQVESIAGGSYDERGQKIGLWKELTERFWNQNELILQGQYDRGRKIGQWEILFRFSQRYSFDNIGGGSYNQANLKNGFWIEQDDDFSQINTILHQGQYQDGVKVGQWHQEKLKDSSLNIAPYHRYY